MMTVIVIILQIKSNASNAGRVKTMDSIRKGILSVQNVNLLTLHLELHAMIVERIWAKLMTKLSKMMKMNNKSFKRNNRNQFRKIIIANLGTGHVKAASLIISDQEINAISAMLRSENEE